MILKVSLWILMAIIIHFGEETANLGQVETIVGPPSTTSHVELNDMEPAAAGVPEGLIRYSVGIEDMEDLKYDLKTALNSL